MGSGYATVSAFVSIMALGAGVTARFSFKRHTMFHATLADAMETRRLQNGVYGHGTVMAGKAGQRNAVGRFTWTRIKVGTRIHLVGRFFGEFSIP